MSLVTFLNICHAVILTVVVTLSANSNIRVSFDWSVILLNMGYVFLLLCTHGTFTFWGAGCFCIPKNTLQLCSGMQLICLETVWPFWVWFCDLLGRCETLLSLQLITSHFWGEIFLNTLPNIPWIMFSNLAIGNMCECQSLFMLILLDGSFSWLQQFSHIYAVISSLLKTQGRPSEDLQGSLSVQLSPLWYYTLQSLAASFPAPTGLSALSPHLRESCSTCIFPPFAVAWKLSQGESWSIHRTYLVCFPSLRDRCPLLPYSNILKTVFSCILSVIFGHFGWES